MHDFGLIEICIRFIWIWGRLLASPSCHFKSSLNFGKTLPYRIRLDWRWYVLRSQSWKSVGCWTRQVSLSFVCNMIKSELLMEGFMHSCMSEGFCWFVSAGARRWNSLFIPKIDIINMYSIHVISANSKRIKLIRTVGHISHFLFIMILPKLALDLVSVRSRFNSRFVWPMVSIIKPRWFLKCFTLSPHQILLTFK